MIGVSVAIYMLGFLEQVSSLSRVSVSLTIEMKTIAP